MSFLRLNKNQIGLQTVGNSHIDSTDKILESNLVLDYTTSSLDLRIKDMSGAVSPIQNKMVAVFGQISGFSVAQGISESVAIDTQLSSIFPGVLANGGDAGTPGVITTSPFNKVPVKISNSSLPLEMQEGGPDIFGRLVYDGGAAEGSRYTVEFFYMDGAVETAAVLPAAATIDMLIPMSMLLSDVPFQSLTHGVAFVDGLPAEHQHTISSITGLQDELDGINGDVSAIDARVTAVEADIATIEGDISTLQTDVGALQESAVALADVALLADLADVATSGDYADLTGAPVLATVATSGSYNDLADKPVVVAPIEGVDLTTQVGDADPAVFSVGVAYRSNSLRVFVNGSRQTRGVQYTEDAVNGTFTFINDSTPTGNDSVTIDYATV